MEENGSSQEDGFDDYYVQDIKFGEFSEIESQSSESVLVQVENPRINI